MIIANNRGSISNIFFCLLQAFAYAIGPKAQVELEKKMKARRILTNPVYCGWSVESYAAEELFIGELSKNPLIYRGRISFILYEYTTTDPL